MEELKPTMNLVVYLIANSLEVKKSHRHYLGGHGYSYNIGTDGKKKLAKDVATTNGYYTANNQKANTVVVVEEIVSLVVPNAETLLDAVLKGFNTILGMFTAPGSVYKNLCLITPHKELQEIFKLTSREVKAGMKFGRAEVDAADMPSLQKLLETIATFKTLEGRKVLFDFPGSAEGGAGNKLAHRQMELAEVISTFGFDKEPELSVQGRKEYETPETDFNKVVSRNSRWFFETVEPERFRERIEGYRKYGFGKVEPDKGYYGKQTPDVTYSTLYTKEPIVLLDKLFDFTVPRIDNPDGYLLAGDLQHLTSVEVARMIDKHPAVPEKNNLVSPITKGNGRPVLIELIKPVLMSYRIRDALTGVDAILQAFLNKDVNNVFHHNMFYDITDTIYTKEANKKGDVKVKLHPDFNTIRSVFKVMVKHPKAVKDVAILLSIGYDIPERNAFNSIDHPDVKVWVVADTRNDKGLRFCTLIETPDFIYIQKTAVADLKVLTLAELGQK